MDEVILDLPASPPIAELHAWIGHYAQGGEGLISASQHVAARITRIELRTFRMVTG
jgi:hypothetical protein